MKRGDMQSSQGNTNSVKLQGYQSVQLGTVKDRESISPAVVKIKVTTGAPERQQEDNPTKRVLLQVVATVHCSLLIPAE